MKQNAFFVKIFGFPQNPPFILGKFHYISDKFNRRNNLRLDKRLFNFQNTADIRQVARIVNRNRLPVLLINIIADVRYSCHQIEIILSFQPLLNNFFVQQTEESAPVAESKRIRGFRLIKKRGIIQF